MDNLIDLEQLNYRDQMIKKYIDEKTADQGGGGGSSDYMQIRLYGTQRYYRDTTEETESHLYLGVPAGTDINKYTIKFLRKSSVRQRNKRDHVEGRDNKYFGYHEIWAIPQKDKVPLIVFDFKDKTAKDFSKGDFDYYEILGVWNGERLNIRDYLAQSTITGYVGEDMEISVSRMLLRKNGGLVLMEGDKPISSHARFHANGLTLCM